jgi:hypothetical protein
MPILADDEVGRFRKKSRSGLRGFEQLEGPAALLASADEVIG